MGGSTGTLTATVAPANATVTKDTRVYYQSVYSVKFDPLDDPKYFISNARIKIMAGENDGQVSAISASWGTNVRRLPMSLSHGQIIDQRRNKFPGLEIPNIYLEIIEELAGKGF